MNNIIDVTPLSVTIDDKPVKRKKKVTVVKQPSINDLRDTVESVAMLGETIADNADMIVIGTIAALFMRGKR